jgi:tRNA dimethylallyltransferase
MDRHILICIVGPTASGKTALALEEAERRGAAILSCDSLCVYRGMDIGTAKPTPQEQARVPHFGIDLAEPDEVYSVSRYIACRDAVLARLRADGRPVIVAGGSGFYLKSFFAPVTDQADIPPEAAAEAAAIRAQAGLDGLLLALRACNPGESEFPGLDLHNPRRVEKALIRCLATGSTYRDLLRDFRCMPPPLPDWDKEVWLVERDPAELQERNRRRVADMLQAGLIEEVRALRARGFERNPSACGAIGYREVLDFLDGRLARERLAEAIITHTSQLVRKQRTWFRHQIPVDRVVRV